MILWTLHPHLSFPLCSSPLPHYLSSSSHPQRGSDSASGWGGLHAELPIAPSCLSLIRSEHGLGLCRRNYSLSHIQLTMAAASMDKPSLGQPKGWSNTCSPLKLLDNEKNLWAGSWGTPAGSVESQGFWGYLLQSCISGVSEKLPWVRQKISKSRRKVKGSVHLRRHELLHENTLTQHRHCSTGDQAPGLFSLVSVWR